MYTRFRKALDKKDNGFTLIELLVVIIIIGILAAIAIPIFLNQRKKAVDASMKSDVRSVATQMETAFTDALAYPTSVTETAAGVTPVVLTITGTPPETVTLSPGNTAVVYTNAVASPAALADKFCVVVSNAKGTRDVVWLSSAGGVQPSTVTTCVAAAAAPAAAWTAI